MAGIIASNGVNGDKASIQGRAAYGIVVWYGRLLLRAAQPARLHLGCHVDVFHLSQGEFGLSLTQDGFLATAFMVRSPFIAAAIASTCKPTALLNKRAVDAAAAAAAFAIPGLYTSPHISLSSPPMVCSESQCFVTGWLAGVCPPLC